MAYKPSPDEIKKLRDETGAGMMDCRAALVSANGDYEAAKKHLADAGMSKVAKKSDRSANEGLVGSYIHVGGKIGALVEVNCETDFVARNERFAELVKDVAMHVAAMPVKYVNREDVPPDELAAVRDELAKEAVEAGKKPEFIERIVEGKLKKWFEDNVLVDQPFIKNDDQTIGELVGQVVGVLGEKIEIRRFAKFALGER
jgi:elongation factor Ts